MDMICGRDVTKYFVDERVEVEKKSLLVTIQTTSSSFVEAGLFGNTAERIGQEENLVPDMALAEAFRKCSLNNEALKLAAKGFRRAASNNLIPVMITFIKNYGAENIIDLQDENPASQKTAFHHAVIGKHVEVVTFLKNSGAKMDIPDATGKTVGALALESDSMEIRELFGVRSLSAIPHS